MIKLTGLKEAKNALKQIEKYLVSQARDQALQDLGEKIGELSADKVPVEFGILKSTFTVVKSRGQWLAGYNTEYASYQHQGVRKDGSRVIRNRKGGGQSFFLTQPIQENRQQLLDFFSRRFKHYLQKAL